MVSMSVDAIAKMHAAARAIRDRLPDQAERLLMEVLRQFPEHPEALRLSAILRQNLQRSADAIALLHRALMQWPDDALLHSDLASSQIIVGDRMGAIASRQRACELAPEQSIFWFNLGRLLQLQGSTAQAINALRRSLAITARRCAGSSWQP
jgi:predicted Zn-dependent protease